MPSPKPVVAEPYELLKAFRELFWGNRYKHRKSTLGDYVASRFYEDLLSTGKCPKLVERMKAGERVVNAKNIMIGKRSRRGDGTFGELVPAGRSVTVLDAKVLRGPVATIEIGVEVKILAKAMMKQIDRVIGDLIRQVKQFRKGGGNPICLAFVGVNYAQIYTSYERNRRYRTDGREYKHPFQEAEQAADKLCSEAGPEFDEFLVLPFVATNVSPYPFEWVKYGTTLLEYSAILTRVSRLYESQFP